ncbi:hypothetical protein DYB30_002363 [Aphanomyces astaci]|uniref:WW domain-containing protein n=1 Tax=Aphanomyces astaci TaxID=112090 RepID=A0A397CPE9_APHAT|nr:hypothetical protein DYB30_002363 [Aphanomyces astaci]RHZ21110.1 hypothetical protein DYB26_004093 [Aphanomyces astaci]
MSKGQALRELQPNDMLNMAQYYNVDLAASPFLLPIIKQAVETPLPPNWVEEVTNNAAPTMYLNEQTNEVQSSHPADAYFTSQIRKAMEAHAETTVPPGHDQAAWMEFRRNNVKYYYNFATNEEQGDVPASGEVFCSQRHRRHDDVSKDVFAKAVDLHRQPKTKSLETLDILCFHSSWNETRLSVTEKRHADIYFSISTKHFQFVLGNLDNVYTISHINGRHERPLEAWDLYVGATITILGRSTTLTKTKLTTQLCKYETVHVDTRPSKCGVSLRRLKNDIEQLREKLSKYRPDVARKIVDALYD